MRIFFYIVLTAVSVVTASIIIAPSIFDINTYKKKITNLVLSQTGYNIEIKSPIKLSLLPKAKLLIKDIKVYKTNSPTLFSSKKLFIYPDLFELLKGKVAFKKIYIENSFFNFVEETKNKNNWTFVKKEKPANANSQKKSNENLNLNYSSTDNKSKSDRIFDIKKIEIKEAKLNYTKENKTYEIKKIDVKIRKSDKAYYLTGNANVLNEEINFKHTISEKNNNEIFISGNIASKIGILTKNLKVNNEFQSNGNIKLSINNLNHFFDNNKISSFPLDLQGNFFYTDNQFVLKNFLIKSFDNEIKAQLNIKNNKANLELSSGLLNLNKYIINKTKQKKATNNNINSTKIESNNEKTNKTNYLELYRNSFISIKPYVLNAKLNFEELKFKKYNLKNLSSNIDKANKIKINMKAENFLEGIIEVSCILEEKGKIIMNVSSKNTNINSLGSVALNKIMSGNIDTKNNLKLNLAKDNKIIQHLHGSSIVSLRNFTLKNINLTNIKESMVEIKKIDDLKYNLKDIFKEDTLFKDQDLNLYLKNGIITLPLSKLSLDSKLIRIDGNYHIIDKKIFAQIGLDNKRETSLLGLFGIRVTGSLGDIKKNIFYNEGKINKILKVRAEKEIKKILKKKLEKNFDNVINNLLN